MARDAKRQGLGELLRLAAPVIGARLGIMVMGLTDVVVVGRWSAEQLGHHALGWAPTSVIMTMAVGLLVGVQVMTARYVGEGRRHEAGAVLRRGLAYALKIGLVSAAGLMAFGPPLLGAMGLEPTLAAGAALPLVILALSLPPHLLSTAASFWLEALGRPGPGMAAMWAANLVNLVLNLILVPGHFDLPVSGAVGSAWATFGARLFLAAVMLAFVLRMREARSLGVFDKPKDGPAAAREQTRIGWGAGASYFVESAAFAGMNVVAGWLGALTVAAWSIVLNLSAVIFMIPLGLAAATAVLVARAYGARDAAGVERAARLGFMVSAVISLLVIAVVWPGAEAIARLYATDPALVALAAPAIALACLFFLSDGLQVVAAQALRARRDVWFPTWVHVFCYAGVMIPLAWALALPAGLGLSGILWAVIVASLLSGAILVARYLWLGRRGGL